ncbi:hypothetical protein BC833DRAFT_588265 [Globomyces pollinis-pini]|nr:hypothetical protein BC833DRAFT_588265 [Globomyces pollinis-pini]
MSVSLIELETIVVSPTNYFLFTPLLPGATTGTVESRSLLESVRKICRRSNAHYYDAWAEDVNFENKTVLIAESADKKIHVPYDKLVIALGARNETYGIPGVRENVHFCKTINDARKIRDKLTSIFEEAASPLMTDEERSKILSFVIVGGGPTGVEFSAELYDFLNRDLINYYPDLVKRHVRVTLIQGADHVLNTFDEAISNYTEDRFRRQNINVVTNAFVQSVDKNTIVYKTKNSNGTNDIKTIPYGLCVWSTGIAMHEMVKRMSSKLIPQTNRKALSVDPNLNVIGAKDVYALGDCSTIVVPKIGDIVLSQCKEGMTSEELVTVIDGIIEKYPQHSSFLSSLKEHLFKVHGTTWTFETLGDRLRKLDSKTTTLPATAQVASQQGAYMAAKLNKIGRYPERDWQMIESQLKPFKYNHLGNFSYVGGDAAVLDLGKGQGTGGFAAFFLWRSAYLLRQVSLRTRVLLAWDWTKTYVFGRDISNI